MNNIYKDVLLGISVADALGVPVEFKDRKYLSENPVTEMMEYGSHNQPIGTWSDDSSMTFCLADVLATDGYDIRKIAKSFYNWVNEGLWTPHGVMFDIGNTTLYAIERYSRCKEIQDYINCGGNTITDNGNGSLMRILPLVFEIRNLEIEDRMEKTRDVSSLTHAHTTSILSCFYYLEFAKLLIEGKDKFQAFEEVQKKILELSDWLNPIQGTPFELLVTKHFSLSDEEEIYSTGYVIHSLEASIWCLLNTDNYKDAVLKAVNLGSDTDTTAAITGGLAGLLYGYETIPAEWLDVLVRRDDIIDLADRLEKKYELENKKG